MILVLATRNAGKVREMRRAIASLGIEVVGAERFGTPAVEETGATFVENAALKAEALVRVSGEWALGEDSGLEVDALDGAPGVYTARYAGEDATDEQNIAKLLSSLRTTPAERRGARFRSAMVLVSPSGERRVAEATCEGAIAASPRGNEGFGYDPVFVPNGSHRTFAEMGLADKQKISHRAKALEEMTAHLRDVARRQKSP